MVGNNRKWEVDRDAVNMLLAFFGYPMMPEKRVPVPALDYIKE